MSLLYGQSPNCTCVQLPGSGRQTGSLPPGCPEATTWGGVARLDPHPEIPAGDSRLDYVDAFTLLGDAMHPTYGHPKTLAQAYDQVYYEGREMGNLPLRGKKTVDQSMAVYQAEYAQIVHRFSTLTRIDCEKFVRPMPTSLVRPDMVYPDKKYEAYCLKVPESGPVVQYEPISDYKMDGLQPRIDLRPGTEIPVYPEDEVDADPHFMSTCHMRNLRRDQNGLQAGSLLKYVLRNTVVTPVTPVLTPRRPHTIQPVSVTADPEPWWSGCLHISLGKIPAGWNSLPFRV